MGGRTSRIEERCDTVLVMFWQTGLTMGTEMMGVCHPLPSTQSPRACTGKTE
jgi:hypothetical protein